MTWIRKTKSRAGLAGFPAEFTPIGRDDLGDPLAVDAAGHVFRFVHGAGDWQARELAFGSMGELERFVRFQRTLAIPADAELADLQARKRSIESYVKSLRRAPYARDAARAALEQLREALADRRFAASKRGQSIAARQELGQRCEAALQAAGAPGNWLVRAHSEKQLALVVMGPIGAEWSEARVRALLQPLLGADYELLFHATR